MRPGASASSGSPRRSLGRQAIALAAGGLLTQAATLVSLVVLTRLVAKPALGGYQQLWLIYGILSPFLVGGVPSALLYFLPRATDRDEERQLVRDAYVVLAVLGVASSLIVLLLRDAIAAGLNDPALSRALLFYAPYPFFMFLSAAMPSTLVASGRAGLAASLNALQGVVTVLVVVAAALVSPTTEGMAAGLSISAAVMALISTATVVRTLGLGGPRSARSVAWRPLVTYGLPLAVTQLATMVGFQIDRIVVSSRYNPADFAVYAIGAVEVPMVIVVRQSVNTVLVPALVRLHAAGDLEGLARQWQAAIRKTSLVVLPLFAFLMVMAGSVIALLYGPKFGGSVRIFRAYLFIVPLRVASYGLITQAIGRTSINFSASVVMLAANAAFAIGLVFPLGLLGPAIATPVAMAVTALYYLARLRGVLSLRFGELLPWRLLCVNLAVSCVSAVPLLGLLAVDLSPFERLAAGGAIYLPIYLAALRLTRRLTPTEWRLLRTTLPLRVRQASSA